MAAQGELHSRGVAQWLARFVRDEEAGGSSPLTPTIFLRKIGNPISILGVNTFLVLDFMI